MLKQIYCFIFYYNIKLRILIFLSFVLFSNNNVFAGPNKYAACSVDMEYQSNDYDTYFSCNSIERSKNLKGDNSFIVAIVAHNVINLDTYQVEVIYNPEQLIYLNTYENSPFENIQNLLETNHGQTLGFQAHKIKNGIINISNTYILILYKISFNRLNCSMDFISNFFCEGYSLKSFFCFGFKSA